VLTLLRESPVPLRRLRPVSARRGLRLTLAALLLPAIGIVVLTQVESVRRPLAEDEATLAVAMHPVGSTHPTAHRAFHAAPTAAAVALARIGPTLLGGSELALRFAGLVAGALALGATVRLGERLFATRVGVIAALVLLAVPEGRAMLGTQLTVDCFFLLPMLVSLASIRNLARAKSSIVWAGVMAGIAVAVAGSAALWLPVLALIWLRRLRGLDWRSFASVIGWTAMAAVVVIGAAIASVGRGAIAGETPLLSAAVPAEVSIAGLARGLLPILPLAILGASHLPPTWSRSESLRFIGWWVLVSGTSTFFTGSVVGPAIGVLFFVAALVAWAFDRAPRTLSWAGAATVGILFSVLPIGSPRGAALEPWAARETARFVKNVLPSERRVAAAEGAARRIAFYSQRDVASLGREADLEGIDYVVVDRATLRTLGGKPPSEERWLAVGGSSMRVIAEFGPWIVARIERSEDSRPVLSRGPEGIAPGPLPTSMNH
jgi:Dolichyl-phosphate-mannose-protein mannosyltransferase